MAAVSLWKRVEESPESSSLSSPTEISQQKSSVGLKAGLFFGIEDIERFDPSTLDQN